MREINVLGYSLKQGSKEPAEKQTVYTGIHGNGGSLSADLWTGIFSGGQFPCRDQGGRDLRRSVSIFEENSSQSTIDTIGEAIKSKTGGRPGRVYFSGKAWENFKRIISKTHRNSLTVLEMTTR